MQRDYADMVNQYYNLATDFYEYGWGSSFHFAPRLKGETFESSLKRHEHFLALRLGLGPQHKVMSWWDKCRPGILLLVLSPPGLLTKCEKDAGYTWPTGAGCRLWSRRAHA